MENKTYTNQQIDDLIQVIKNDRGRTQDEKKAKIDHYESLRPKPTAKG
jgi:hypothetical protein